MQGKANDGIIPDGEVLQEDKGHIIINQPPVNIADPSLKEVETGIQQVMAAFS